MLWYYKLLARRPHFVVASIGVFSVACIVVALVAKKLPDFDDPTLGFEARGTSIGRRWTAWRNLLEETSPSGRLMANPKELLSEPESTSVVGFGGNFGVLRKRKKNKKAYDSGKKWGKLRTGGNPFQILKKLNALNKSVAGEMINFQEYDKKNDTFHLYHDNWAYGKNVPFYTEESDNKTIAKKWSKWETLKNLEPPPHILQKHSPVDEFFCESPNKEFAHFVVQRVKHNLNDTLFELNAFLAICDLEHKIVRTERYEDLCQKELTRDNCCRPWSVVNYVTLLVNKTSCFELNEEDIAMVKTLLFDCFQYYNDMKLSNDCAMSSCVAPVECKQHNAVYNILHYLADVDFIKLNESAEFLNATMIFLPIARSTKALEFYHSLRQENLGNDLVAVVAIDMGLKNALFDECLLRDGWLVGLGGIFVVISMWLYTKSLFVTLMTVVAVTFSLGIAYFIYAVIFELSFFPFMNLLAVIVVVGIGADDAFIFLKIWQCVQVDRARNNDRVNSPSSGPSTPSTSRATSDSLIVDMSSTLKHAAVSMLVTSLTTAAAFYASSVSSITAIRCFGIFSGTAVMANYLLMITWLPAAVSIAERAKCAALAQPHEAVLGRLATPFRAISRLGSKVEDLIISAVISVPLLWIVLLGIIGILSGVMVLHWPKLRLPDSPDFKLFISSHPFERYDSEYRDMFWFEKIYGTSDSFKLPLRFVWGVQPVDRGNFLDPERRGQLYFDESFNMSAPESQEWLLGFCRSLKNQTFYQMSSGMLLPNCFIENFINWMSRRCNDTMEENDRTPCCEVSPFPFAPDVFDACLPDSISSLYATPREIFIPGVAGPKFARQVEPGTESLVKAVVVEYESNQMFTMSYGEIDEFVRTVEEWFGRMLADAPVEMRNGWFTSELEFFDLQDTLSTGTLVAICMAMAVGLLVLLLVTLNVLISLYAIVTVTLSILTTVAVLVLAGWKLNVLESVAVSTAIGLAVDFSLHYGVHYRLATSSDRKSSTRFSLTRMIGPTAMAALTTGIAGALMLPSTVLAYIQIGVFLVIVMSVSWIYATFFLMSLLRLFGPQHGFGQFRYPRLRTSTRRESANTQRDDANQPRLSIHNQVSPLLLSNSSSVGGEIGSESHELDSMPSSSLVKPSSLDDSLPINFERVLNKSNPLQSPSTVSNITTFPPDEVDL